MSAKITYYTISVFFGMFLDSGTYIAQSCPGLCSSDAYFHTFFGDLYQPSHLRIYISNHKHTWGIWEISFIDSWNIYINNISTTQNFIFTWYTVTYYFVDACTYTFGESFIIEWGRDSTVARCEVIYHTVDFFCRHAFTNVLGNIIQQCSIDFSTFAYTFQLFRCTEYLSWREFYALFSVFLNFIFYLVRVIRRGEPEALDELFHCFCIFYLSVNGTKVEN